MSGERILCGWGCIETACIDKQCPEDTQCRAGECIELICLGISCEENQICQKGECVSNKCKNTVCGEGYKCNDNGECETTQQPIITIRAQVDAVQKILGDGHGVSTHENAFTPTNFEISLGGVQPTKNVTFTITSSNTDEVIVQTPEITFTPENWNIPQYIMVIGVPDHRVDGDQEVTITVTTTSEDTKYNNYTDSFTIVNLDDDYEHLVVTAPEEPIIYEGAFCRNWLDGDHSLPAEREFSVRLGSIPKYELWLNIKTDGNYGCLNRGKNDNDHSICPLNCSAEEVVHFDETNWDQEVTFTISDWDSNFVDSVNFFDINFKLQQIAHNDPSLWDYDSLEVEPLRILRVDNDKPAIIPESNSVETWDNGMEVKVCGKLSRSVSQKVMVTASVDTADVVVDTSEPQEMWGNRTTCFTLHGVQDSVIDEDTEYHVTLTPESTGDFTPESATLVLDAVNHNTDVASIYFDQTRVILDEGQSVTLKAKLASKPTGQVKLIPVIPANENGKIYSLDKTEYMITPEQWDKGVDIKLTALENPTVSNNRTENYNFKFETDTDDTNYKDKSFHINFAINDINTRSIHGELHYEGMLSEAQAGEWLKYTVTLGYLPESDADFEIHSSDTRELQVRPFSDMTGAAVLNDGGFRYRLPKDKWNTGFTFEVSPVDDGHYDYDSFKKVYIDAFAHDSYGYISTPLGPYIIRDIHSQNIRVECTNDVLDCGKNRCFILLYKTTNDPVQVDITTTLKDGFSISPLTMTFGGPKGTSMREFEINYTKNDSYKQAYIKNELQIHASGTIEFSIWHMQKIPFYSRCQTVYDSRTSENAANTGIKLPAGSYKLEVLGASGGSYFDSYRYQPNIPVISTERGKGTPGSYATGVLTLNEETTVYPWYGYGGKNGYLTSVPCDPTSVNCGGQGGYEYNYGQFSCDGGGASDIRIGTNDLAHRVIIGAGGGGDGNMDAWKYNHTANANVGEDGVHGQSATWQARTINFNGLDRYRYDNSPDHSQSNGYKGFGAGGGGLYYGTNGDKFRLYYNSYLNGYGGNGGMGFVFTQGVTPSEIELTNNYMLTEVNGYDSATDKVHKEYLDCRFCDHGEDGVVVITSLPR